ncbi:hypothetical protein [Aliterella atlantica]|uniref:hypothetical protein n=1 Tax=Aliterella atlantica TaxID=1827278 RepID=UPI0011854EBC|nr:hypothetical protein [Aliterella atlantica]
MSLIPLFLATSVKATNLILYPITLNQPQSLILTQGKWQQFSSSAGKFTVSLPGKPIEDLETDDDGSVANNFTVVDGETVYLVTYSDLVKEVNRVATEEIFDAVGEGYTADGDKLVNQREVKLDEYPGRVVELNTTDGMVGKATIYLVGNRLYQLIVISPNKEIGEQFFESFRISD